LQKQLKELVKGNFELRNTRNRTGVVNDKTEDFSAIKSHFDDQRTSYFTFYPKSQKPVQDLICYLKYSNPEENISIRLMSPRFDVISVKQKKSNQHQIMQATSPSHSKS
jgi:tRNA U34 5-carboxymethylaminomethyl modifying enzyme MnmG/GidA